MSNDSIGTVLYLAPQRFDNKFSDPCASDIWALGVTLYEMVCGSKLF